MNNKLKLSLIIIGIIVAIILFTIILFATANNKVIFYEEQIKESQSAVRIQEKRRLDLIINLVDSVKSYNKYEQETMKKIV